MAVWAATMCLHASCAPVPDLAPHVTHVEIAEQIDEAKVIVVGVVQNEQALQKVAGTDETGPLQLFSVSLRVEGVLKGRISGDRVIFYYYQSTGRAWNGPAPNIITTGERGIFYLVREGELLRATTDAFLSHTSMESGKHTVSAATSQKGVHEAIAQLVLLPGEDMDLSGYLGSLHAQKALALALVGQARVSQMLQSLLKNPEATIRGRACIMLAEFPLNEKGCLREIIKDRGALAEDRKRAEELLGGTQKP